MEIPVLRRRYIMMDDKKENLIKHLEKDVENLNISKKDLDTVIKYIPLYYAALNDDSQGLAKFLSSGEFGRDEIIDPILYAKFHKFNITPLRIAALNGNTEIVQLLINCGMDVNVADYDNVTPLHYAATAGNYEMLKMLLEAGANCYIYMGSLDCPMPSRYPSGFTALHLAANYCNIECIKELLKFGANCGARDRLNRTCLLVAAEAGSEECILYLLRNSNCKSFLSLPSFDDRIPLHFAVKYGMLECVKEMVRLGSDINHRDRNNMSPLHCICLYRTLNKSIRMEILKVLVLEGRNTDMNSAFHPSHFHQYTPDVKAFLIAYGANIDVKSKNTGFTFFEHELFYSQDHNFLKFVTESLPTLPFLQSLKIFPSIDNIPDKSTMWYSSVLPNDVSFSLVRGKSNMYVEMSSITNQRSVSSYFQTQLDTVINRPLKKLFLLQQPFLDLLYNHIYEMLDWNSITTDYLLLYEYYKFDSSNSSYKRQLLQLFNHLWYQKLASEPRSLRHYCRHSIRKCMAPSNVRYINKLPLPISLKSYLMFDHSA